MKNSNFLTFLLTVFVSITITSCVEDDDFNIPTLTLNEPNVTVTNSLSNIVNMANGGLVDFSQIDGNTENTKVITSGYVVSNDEAGNFYKTIIIQDAPENPTAAIQLDVDATSLYSQYKPGQKVYVVLNNPDVIDLEPLGMKEVNGVLHIGQIDGNDIERISGSNYTSYILRSTEITPIVPKLITSEDFENNSYVNMLVRIENMQVVSSEVGLTYANLNNTFSVNRNLISCVDNEEIVFRNSGFADFKSVEMPSGKGSIVAVFSRYNSNYQLFIRDTDDVDFNENRCDPLFEESFNSGNITDNWTSFSVTGSQEWYFNTFGNPNNSATMSGYQSGSSNENEDWLISKPIDLTSVSSAVLKFQNVKRFNGNDIEVYFATDYTSGQDPNTSGSWTQLAPDLDTNTNSWSSWVNSGSLDISAAAGSSVYIAFKYTSTSSSSATWEIDNIVITE